jgi:hypothetical protein
VSAQRGRPRRGRHRAPRAGLRRRARRYRPAFPGADPSAPSFDDEIRAAVRYERGLAVKAVLCIALVALVLTVRVYFFG